MAQMPIQTMSGRADPFSAASPAAVYGAPPVAIPRAAYLYDSGGISGGKLRPGSIDQELFKAYLAAARKEAVAAPAMPVPAPAAHSVVARIRIWYVDSGRPGGSQKVHAARSAKSAA